MDTFQKIDITFTIIAKIVTHPGAFRQCPRTQGCCGGETGDGGCGPKYRKFWTWFVFGAEEPTLPGPTTAGSNSAAMSATSPTTSSMPRRESVPPPPQSSVPPPTATEGPPHVAPVVPGSAAPVTPVAPGR
ncbi:MAG: hypothetical protein M1815_003207, partial [Lichina confinis]